MICILVTVLQYSDSDSAHLLLSLYNHILPINDLPSSAYFNDVQDARKIAYCQGH